VSDNTRHRALHHPITTTSPSHQPSSTSTRKTSLNIPSIPEVNTDDLPSNITSIPEDRIVDPSLYLSHDDRDSQPSFSDNTPPTNSDDYISSSSTLSSKQVQEILSLVTKQPETHGRISPELLKMLETNQPSSRVSTSTTPMDHPTLLSCDKMSNTAPASMRYTIQQLSRYFGFQSLKIGKYSTMSVNQTFCSLKPLTISWN
jgi:hypothetical protein